MIETLFSPNYFVLLFCFPHIENSASRFRVYDLPWYSLGLFSLPSFLLRLFPYTLLCSKIIHLHGKHTTGPRLILAVDAMKGSPQCSHLTM